MGVVYKAKAHLKSPFDPENKRVKGIYDWDQTTHVKTDEKKHQLQNGTRGGGIYNLLYEQLFLSSVKYKFISNVVNFVLIWWDSCAYDRFYAHL